MPTIVVRVQARLKRGMTLEHALEEVGVSYDHWRAICVEHGIATSTRGRKPAVYTLERVREVKRRIRAGEFVKEIALDMGMNPKNLARYCRRHGIKLFSKASLAKNYERRSALGARRGRKPGSSKIVPKVQALIARGLSDAEIAEKLSISISYTNLIRRGKHIKSTARPETTTKP